MEMPVLPAFETERLLIRPRSLADLEDCLAMDRDPLVTRFVPGPWSEPEQHRAFVLDRMERAYPDGLGYWSVVDRKGPATFLGWVLLLPYNAVRDEVEIGWRFTRGSWGRGYATEASSVVLEHAFRGVGLELVVADIDPLNVASIRVAEKLGMRLVEDRCLDGDLARSYQIRSDQIGPPRSDG